MLELKGRDLRIEQQRAAPGGAPLAVIALALALGGCFPDLFGDDSPPPPPTPAPTPKAVQPAPAPPATAPPMPAPQPAPQPQINADQAMQAKLNLYVSKCLNRFSRRARQSKQRYLSWCDGERGPTGQERYIYGLYTLVGDPNQCTQAVTEAATMPPAEPQLQAMAQNYVAALSKLHPLLTQAHNYYERENYRDDDMARGKALHPQLMEAWAAFETADDALSTDVDRRQSELLARELARIAQQGESLQYHIKNVLMHGKRVVQDTSTGEGYEDIDRDSFITTVSEFESAVDAMDRYSKAHSQESEGLTLFSSYLNESQQYVTEAKLLMRRVRDQTPYERMERRRIGTSSEWMVDGSPGATVKAFNEFTRAYNRLR